MILSARLGSCVVQSLLSWPWRQQLAQNVVPVPTWRQQAADNDVQRLSKHRFIRNNTKLLQVQQNPSASKRSVTWKRSKTSANASPQRFQQTLLQLNRSKTVASAAILRFQHNFFVDVYRREDASIHIYIYMYITYICTYMYTYIYIYIYISLYMHTRNTHMYRFHVGFNPPNTFPKTT